MLTLITGVFISIGLAVLGILINHYKCYKLIAGYHRATEEVKNQYDIQGLAEHIGNGLVTLGVLLIFSVVALYFGFNSWFKLFIGLFVFIALVIIIGTRKFMPARRNLMRSSPADAKHPFLYWLLPAASYRTLEIGTRQWLQVCNKCGHKQDFWEAGGVRQGGFGEPAKLQLCENCQKLRMHKIRRKTESESIELKFIKEVRSDSINSMLK